MKVVVIGCGYVGLATGTVLADLGHQVTGLEISQRKLDKLHRGVSPIFEAYLDDILLAAISAGKLSFTNNYIDACSDAEVIIVAVGTPTMETWAIDLTQLESSIDSIADAFEKREKRDSPVVVAIKSTIPSGVSDYLRDRLAAKTDFPFVMVANPEFLREGQAISDTYYPDRIVIGSDSDLGFYVMESLYEKLITQSFDGIPPRPKRPKIFTVPVPVVKTSPRSAEMIKYASNAFLATKISFINEIANLCEEIGADINDVAYGIGLDPRIGRQFLRAGIGYGGSCFPKDTKALHQHAGSRGYTFTLLNAVIEVNRIQRYRFLAKIRQALKPLGKKTLGILGLAFK
ncbi:MAG TPA: UDP-glucose/GDP-mannose dehydrogenase family protein, partial [Firmicutes bacterium]|nr:UDP-glucose/GDP-mannose dehydrogenase family protein [Bacillota bacterium]